MVRSFFALLLLFLAATIIHAGRIPRGDHGGHSSSSSDEHHGLQSICGVCVRYVQGFDITGVTNDVVFTFANGSIKSECDCFKKCLENKQTCTNWVWKFTDGSGYRTCTIYSNFNLPPAVTLGFNVGTSVNAGVIGQNPQAGGQVPHCQTYDKKGNAIGNDPNCFSGPLWFLDNNKFLC